MNVADIQDRVAEIIKSHRTNLLHQMEKRQRRDSIGPTCKQGCPLPYDHSAEAHQSIINAEIAEYIQGLLEDEGTIVVEPEFYRENFSNVYAGIEYMRERYSITRERAINRFWKKEPEDRQKMIRRARNKQIDDAFAEVNAE